MAYATHDASQTYEWALENGPLEMPIPARPLASRATKIWDLDLLSPTGIAAGPAYDSEFVRRYLQLGFDTVIYKTVRSIARDCHPFPNCLFVDDAQMLRAHDIGKSVVVSPKIPSDLTQLAITNSFGVPSVSPEHWMQDFDKAKSFAEAGQSVWLSAMGTHHDHWDIVSDYVRVASMGKDVGAEVIEINYSCPNLNSSEGAIYTTPYLSAQISKAVKAAIGSTKLVIKIGYIADDHLLAELVAKNAPHIDGIAAINTIKMQAVDANGHQALPGNGRLESGICGSVILDLAQEMVVRLADLRAANQYDFEIVGVGGITQPKHFDEYLARGASIAMSGSAAMWNAYLAHDYLLRL